MDVANSPASRSRDSLGPPPFAATIIDLLSIESERSKTDAIYCRGLGSRLELQPSDSELAIHEHETEVEWWIKSQVSFRPGGPP